MHISINSFLSVILHKPFINFLYTLLWEINEEKKSEPVYVPKTFSAPCFWLVWFASSYLPVMGYAIISQSHVTQALFVWVDVIGLYPTMNSMRVIMIDCQNLFKVFCAYPQQGFLFPESSFLPLPTSPPSRLLKPQLLFHFPACLKNYWQPCRE